MTNYRPPLKLILYISLFLLGCQWAPEPSPSQAQSSDQINVLFFTETAGFRHDSIDAAVQLMDRTGAFRNWYVEGNNTSEIFTDENLARFDVVVFLLTSGDVLSNDQQAAFERYIQAGGGFAGVHSASDTEYDWPWYGGLVGAYFNGHPPIQTAVIEKSVANDPTTVFFPNRWEIEDEWYNFRTNPAENSDITVLLWLDESTYSGGNMGSNHPIAWSHNYDGGRAWYTAAGHRSELYSDPQYQIFQNHLIAGIEWAAGLGEDAGKPPDLTESVFLPSIMGN